MTKSHIAIIGGGPAGLMAAEHLAQQGARVTVYDRMPTPGRKFPGWAGRGGLNLTHSEPLDTLLSLLWRRQPASGSGYTGLPSVRPDRMVRRPRGQPYRLKRTRLSEVVQGVPAAAGMAQAAWRA